EATARGCLFVVEEACRAKTIPRRGATVAIQGFGNAGSIAARLFHEKRARVEAISDSRGAIYNPRGLDPSSVILHKEHEGAVAGTPGAARITNEELLALK